MVEIFTPNVNITIGPKNVAFSDVFNDLVCKMSKHCKKCSLQFPRSSQDIFKLRLFLDVSVPNPKMQKTNTSFCLLKLGSVCLRNYEKDKFVIKKVVN